MFGSGWLVSNRRTSDFAKTRPTKRSHAGSVILRALAAVANDRYSSGERRTRTDSGRVRFLSDVPGRRRGRLHGRRGFLRGIEITGGTDDSAINGALR